MSHNATLANLYRFYIHHNAKYSYLERLLPNKKRYSIFHYIGYKHSHPINISALLSHTRKAIQILPQGLLALMFCSFQYHLIHRCAIFQHRPHYKGLYSFYTYNFRSKVVDFFYKHNDYFYIVLYIYNVNSWSISVIIKDF